VNFKKFFNVRYSFIKPQKKDILIYDYQSWDFAEIIFSREKYDFLYVRYEQINLYVLAISVLKNGLKDLTFNYKKNYIDLVSPKLIFSSIDNDIGFFLLRQKLFKYTFVLVQNGMRDNYCINIFKNYIKLRKKITFDYIFVFGDNDKIELKKYFKARIFSIGNLKNNSITIKKKRKSNYMLYIQQAKIDRLEVSFQKKLWNREKKILNQLSKMCVDMNLNLIILSKYKYNKKKFFEREANLKKFDYIFTGSLNNIDRFKLIDESRVIVTIFSTLGFEALSRGNKVVFFPLKNCFPSVNYYNNYLSTGLFWSSSENFLINKNLVHKILNYSDTFWRKASKQYSKKILKFDKNNFHIKKIIKNILQN
jgi:surface carbohydrate biosynthesis protein